MNELLIGAYDMHVHTAPDVVKRKITDIELAKRYIAAGFAGFVIKSHQFCTAARAALVREVFPECNAIGSITLNNAAGGLNPVAVEMAARMGAKEVWFPTVDALNQYNYYHKNSNGIPCYGSIDGEINTERLTILKDGKLKSEVYDILEIINKYDMVLSTGHISPQESYKLLFEAYKIGIKRMILTHPDFPCTAMPITMQKELIRELPVYIEHDYCQIWTGESTWESVINQIRAIGPERCIICSDGGQFTNIYPEEACELYCRKLLEYGFKESDIHKVFIENQNKILGL